MADLIKNLILPSHLIALLLFLGVLMMLFRWTRSRARLALIAGAVTYIVFSNGVVAALLISPLEYRYPALVELDDWAYVNAAVVLTAYAADDPSMPLSSRGGGAATFRVMEAARLYHDGNVDKIIVSGNASAAAIMADLLEIAGVPGDVLKVDGAAQHTSSSAENLRRHLDGKEFFLVTSSGHMPRAVGVFRASGLNPVPSPTDYQLPDKITSASMMPSPNHLLASDLAIHEYAGLLWYWLSGETDRFW